MWVLIVISLVNGGSVINFKDFRSKDTCTKAMQALDQMIDSSTGLINVSKCVEK